MTAQRLSAALASDEDLRAALESADIVPLLMTLVQLTGDSDLLERMRPHIKGPWDFSESIPDTERREIRERLFVALKQRLAQGGALPALPPEDLLRQMMSVAVGEQVPAEYTAMLREEMALEGHDMRGVEWRRPPDVAALQRFHVVVIGAGMSGLCAAIRLRQIGIPFTVLEKNADVGGTWLENRYPGCGVDTPNHFYCYSFEPNHDWSHFFSKRDELWSYFSHAADRHDIRRDIRFNTEAQRLDWDEGTQRWRIVCRGADGAVRTIEANAVMTAVGQLNRPKIPDIPGLSGFDGPVLHTAQWDPRIEVAGKRVAMIGTGASGMQVGPAMAPLVDRLTVYQRSPHWAAYNPNYHRTVPADTKWALANIPYYARWYRFQLFWGFADGIYPALQVDPTWPDQQRSTNAMNERFRRSMERHIRHQLADAPALVEKSVPPYPPYGKRILIDNRWYEMLKRPNVDLVTDGIERIEGRRIFGRDGQAREHDVVVLATGFKTTRILWPIVIHGRDGRDLQEIWHEDDPRAYLGITVPHFPNLFLVFGPNTALGHGGSAIFQTECQVRYIVQCLRDMVENGWRSLDCRQEVHDAYNRRVDAALDGMVWSHSAMSNWYKNSKGRVVTNWPWRLVDYWAMTAQPNYRDYRIAP